MLPLFLLSPCSSLLSSSYRLSKLFQVKLQIIHLLYHVKKMTSSWSLCLSLVYLFVLMKLYWLEYCNRGWNWTSNAFYVSGHVCVYVHAYIKGAGYLNTVIASFYTARFIMNLTFILFLCLFLSLPLSLRYHLSIGSSSSSAGSAATKKATKRRRQ